MMLAVELMELEIVMSVSGGSLPPKPMKPEDFHPLSIVETISTESDDSPANRLCDREVMNSWALASIIWCAVKERNLTARKMAEELFCISHNNLLDPLLRQNDEAATRQAIAILATALEDKIEAAFSNNS